MVGYLTSLYDRATEIAQMIDAQQHVRLSEQAIKLYYAARVHKDEITQAQANGQQTLASETFFHALGDLQEAQSSIGSVVTDSERITSEIQFWNRLSYDLCRVTRGVVGVVHITLECIDPALEYAPVSTQIAGGQAAYGYGPPADLAAKLKESGVAIHPDAKAATSHGEAATDELDGVYAVLDGADAFFKHVGLDQISTRISSPLNALYTRAIKSALNALRTWFIPAAYGSLGAAIFFTRRSLNPTMPNPDMLRVIYRILFGGFAGIVFAWFWAPLQAHDSAVPLSSLSAFGIAFLAGYSTDILFQLLDRLVEAASAQIRRSPAQPGPT